MLEVVDRALSGRKVEDDRIELKAEWPDAHRAARQIAGHANASGTEPVLWIIGIDENRARVCSVDTEEASSWWHGVRRWFDGDAPELTVLNVTVRPGTAVVALEFQTDRAPYVVGTKSGGQVQREVPWREGNATRSAHRHELLRSVVAQASVPTLELIRGQLTLTKFDPGSERHHDPHPYSSLPLEQGDCSLSIALSLFLSSRGVADLPEHRQTIVVASSLLDPIPLDHIAVSGPFRHGRYTQTGGRERIAAGAIDVLGNSSLAVQGSGALDLRAGARLTEQEGEHLRRARRVTVLLQFPIDLSDRIARLESPLHFVAGSGEKPGDQNRYSSWRRLAAFQPAGSSEDVSHYY